VALADDGTIDAECLPDEVLDERRHQHGLPTPAQNRPPLARLTADDEGQRLLEALRRHQWNITAVADELAVARSTLYRKMKKYRIVPPNREG
jgi:transcriptional regulator of acetoin/glycerol metabolism